MEDVIVTAAEMRRRLIPFCELRSDSEAFVDTRLPGSTPKYNYAMIGSGVSQNPNAHINLRESHGFNIGGASMPNGVTNSLHMHFTAEVFICFKGEWKFRWGPKGDEGEIIGREGDIVSVPTWIYRGFTNVGSDDGFLFTTLGQDVTGGVIWNPHVMQEALRTGLAINRKNELVDLHVTPDYPKDDLLPMMSDAEIQKLRKVSKEEMRRRVVTPEDRVWSLFPMLDNCLPGGDKQVAPVIGFGLSESRDTFPPIVNPHGFKHEWLRARAGNGIHMHRHSDTQVYIVKDGTWEVTLNRGSAKMTVRLEPWTVFSVPPGAWRSLQCVEGDPGLLLMVTGGDNRTRIEWDARVVQAAAQNGWGHDANGYVAPLDVLALAAV
jgi:quercetin dioxygenase-like cupin family protein